MRIHPASHNINFGRKLNTEERKDMKETSSKAFEVLGHKDGKRIFVMPDTCMPKSTNTDTGIGILSSDATKEYLKFMDDYINYTHLKILPFGQPDGYKDFYCNYKGTVMSPGVQHINLELLKNDEFGNILTEEEFQQVVKQNQLTQNEQTQKTLINFHNVMDDNSPQDKALRQAYERFKTSTHPNIETLKKDFENFKTKNKDWLDIYSIYYGVLKKENNNRWFRNWDKKGIDRNLYNPEFPKELREKRLNQIKTEHKDDLEFYKFKQFIAEKHFLIGKANVNKLGKKLITDCPINFDDALVHAFPKAFLPYPAESCFGLPMFNHDEISNPDSIASKLLMRKIERTAELGDVIRLDVGWQYLQSAAHFPNGKIDKINFTDILVNRIEKTVKKVKGENFDPNDILYEFDAGPEEFTPFVDKKHTLTPAAKKVVKVYNATYSSKNWGTSSYFTKIFGEDKFVIGLNHDPVNLIDLAEDLPSAKIYNRKNHLEVLAKFFNVDESTINSPVEFMKAKFAEITSAKNHMHFFMNIFGRRERFQHESFNGERNWGYGVPYDYETAFNKALQSGYGYNLMDSLEKLFKLAGLDKTQKQLYDKIVYYRDEMYKPDIITNSEEITEVVMQESKTGSKNNKFTKALIGITFAAAAIGSGLYIYLQNRKQQNNVQKTA